MFDFFNNFSETFSEPERDYDSSPSFIEELERQDNTTPEQAEDQALADFGRGLSQEGLAGLLDPMGMLDRQDAQRDLAGKFEVVESADDAVLPNQVTAEQYEQISRTYSDIRMGRSDINIDTSTADDPEWYQHETMDDIGDIMQSESGRTLINQLANNVNGTDAAGNPIHHTTTIQPRLDAAGLPDNTNAEETGDSSSGIGSPHPDGTHGAGGDTSVDINPGRDIVIGPGTFRSDVMLFHELTHSYHDSLGTTDTDPVTALDAIGFGGLDLGVLSDANAGVVNYEHQAAGLGRHRNAPVSENAYRAERNQIALSGLGSPGDFTMPQRDQYVNYSGTYTPFFGF